MGFWQAAIREPDDPDYGWLTRYLKEATPFTVELLYGDAEGGQRTITRFGMIPMRVDEDVAGIPQLRSTRIWTGQILASASAVSSDAATKSPLFALF